MLKNEEKEKYLKLLREKDEEIASLKEIVEEAKYNKALIKELETSILKSNSDLSSPNSSYLRARGIVEKNFLLEEKLKENNTLEGDEAKEINDISQFTRKDLIKSKHILKRQDFNKYFIKRSNDKLFEIKVLTPILTILGGVAGSLLLVIITMFINDDYSGMVFKTSYFIFLLLGAWIYRKETKGQLEYAQKHIDSHKIKCSFGKLKITDNKLLEEPKKELHDKITYPPIED